MADLHLNLALLSMCLFSLITLLQCRTHSMWADSVIMVCMRWVAPLKLWNLLSWSAWWLLGRGALSLGKVIVLLVISKKKPACTCTCWTQCVCVHVLMFWSVLLDYLAYSLVSGSAYLAGLTTFIRSLFSPISHTSLVFSFVLVFKYSTFLLHTVTLVSLVMYQSVGKFPTVFYAPSVPCVHY